MRYLWLFFVLACAPPSYAATIYKSIYNCEGGHQTSSEGIAAYQGFLCTNEARTAQPDHYAITNADARMSDLLTKRLADIEDRIKQLNGSVDFADHMTQQQLTRERDSLTRQLQAYRQIDY